MTPLMNPLRNLWGRVQGPAPPARSSVANLDGVSDEASQSYHPNVSSHQQQLHDVSVLTNTMPSLPDANQTFARTGENLEVKQEPTSYEQSDADLFAQFTNESTHHDDVNPQVDVHLHQDTTTSLLPKVDSTKAVPEAQGQQSSLAAERAGAVDSTAVDHSTSTGPHHVQDQTNTPLYSTTNPEVTSTLPKAQFEDISSASQSLHDATSQPRVSIPKQSSTAASNESTTTLPFDQIPQDVQQKYPASDSVSGFVKNEPSSSAVDSRSLSLEATVLSLSDLGSPVSSRILAQQWQQRPQLLDDDSLMTQTSQPLSTPMPSLQPYQPEPRSTTIRPNLQHTASPSNAYLTSPLQHTHSEQQIPSFPHNMMYQAQHLGTPRVHPRPLHMPHGYAFPSLVQRSSLSASSSAGFRPPSSPAIQRNNITKEEELEQSESEPLATRAPRHRPVATRPTLSTAAGTNTPSKEIESVSPDALGNNANFNTQAAPNYEDDRDDDEDTTEPISWKLPSFEVTYHPPTKVDAMPTVKVSIPNLVREEVALTEDHSEEEMQLFISVFLPSQQALAQPDPEPAHAVINFHTIAVMVLEAFVQWEIGDEMGRGYGFHGGNTSTRPVRVSDDEEPARTRAAQEADVDEIFFAVVDRWRAGLLANKPTFKLIRGCQEFCDVALEIIHYVKEHGVSQPEQRKRRVRSDKGVPRGARNKDTAGGAKRKAVADADADTKGSKKVKPNTLQARKKTKTDESKKKPTPKPKPKPKAKPKPKPKAKGKNASVTVVPKQ